MTPVQFIQFTLLISEIKSVFIICIMALMWALGFLAGVKLISLLPS